MKNNTTRILTIAVILLLVANIALVFIIMRGRKGPDRRDGRKDPSEMMSKELNMTDQQEKDFKSLKEAHFKNVKPLFDSIRASKTAFFSLIKDPNVSDSLINASEQQVLSQQARLDKLTFDHFKRVRALFTPEQLPRYDSFINKMMDRRRGGDRQGKDGK
jgi:Spy/CpxP family protein refolding chaperone